MYALQELRVQTWFKAGCFFMWSVVPEYLTFVPLFGPNTLSPTWVG